MLFRSLAVCRLYNHFICLISFHFHFQSMKLAINSWSYHFLSCSTSPVDNAHVPLYYEYIHLIPAVCRLYNHIICQISFLLHFQSIKLAINSWSYFFSVAQPLLLTTLTSSNHQISCNLLHMAIYKSCLLSNTCHQASTNHMSKSLSWSTG